MKDFTRFLSMLTVVFILFVSCKDDDPGQWCGMIPSETAVASIAGGGFRGTSLMTINESAVKHFVDCGFAFDSLSSNSVGALIMLLPHIEDGSPELDFEELYIWIEEPVNVSGSAYDVSIEYEGDALMRDGSANNAIKTPLEWISLKGWMKNEIFSSGTRCSIGLIFDCELELVFMIGEYRYVVTVGPQIYWPS